MPSRHANPSVLKSPGVGEKMGDRHRLWKVILELKKFQILIDILIQIQLTPFRKLHDGRYMNQRILNELTAQNMQSQHFTQDPRVAGTAYGFYERLQNDQRMIEHGGDVFCTSSLLLLIPKQNLGFFVSYTRMDSALRENLVNEFLDRYFPVGKSLQTLHLTGESHWPPNHYNGYYLYNRYSRTTLEKLVALFSQCHLTGHGSGFLEVSYPFGGKKSMELAEAGPLLFKRLDNGNLVAFKEDHQGGITQFFDGTRVFDRLPWYQSLPFQLSLVGFFVLVFFSVWMVWFVEILVGRFKRHSFPGTFSMRSFRGLLLLVSGLDLFFLFGMAISYWRFDEFDWVFGAPREVILLLCIPILGSAVSIALPVFVIIEWRKGLGTPFGRLYHWLISITALGFIEFLNYWNLLGFRY